MTKNFTTNRENPITFRFPRGTSGRKLAEKFYLLKDLFSIKTNSGVLLKCIEECYMFFFSQKMVLKIDLEGDTAIFFSDINEEDKEMVEAALEWKMKQPGIESAAEAIIEIFKAVDMVKQAYEHL